MSGAVTRSLRPAPADHALGVQAWPFFELEVRTPRLVLRVPDDAALEQLAELASAGIHDATRAPFTSGWTLATPEEIKRNLLQWNWRGRAELSARSWRLPFGVWDGEVLVGAQDLFGEGFALTRTFHTGSWVGRNHQGRGIGKEMRAAVLHLGFEGLEAERAETEAFCDNEASQRVTRSLGYRPNGEGVALRPKLVDGAQVGEEPARLLRFVLTRDEWRRCRRDDIEIVGLEPCLPLLGLGN